MCTRREVWLTDNKFNCFESLSGAPSLDNHEVYGDTWFQWPVITYDSWPIIFSQFLWALNVGSLWLWSLIHVCLRSFYSMVFNFFDFRTLLYGFAVFLSVRTWSPECLSWNLFSIAAMTTNTIKIVSTKTRSNTIRTVTVPPASESWFFWVT